MGALEISSLRLRHGNGNNPSLLSVVLNIVAYKIRGGPAYESCAGMNAIVRLCKVTFTMMLIEPPGFHWFGTLLLRQNRSPGNCHVFFVAEGPMT